MNDSIRDTDLHSRMAGAEANIQAIGKDIQQVAESLSSYARETSAHLQLISEKGERNHNDLRKAIVDSSKTTWAPIIGAFAVAVTIVVALIGFGANGYIRDMDRIEYNQKEMHLEVNNHIREVIGSHASAKVRIEHLEKQIDMMLGIRKL